MPTKSTQLMQAFLVGRLLAERAGLGSAQTTQWGAVLMATGLSPMSILLVSELARLDAANLATQADQQRQLQDTIEQAARTTQHTAEIVVAKLEQMTIRLNQMSDRLSQLEAQTANTCTQATCAELLALLHDSKLRRRKLKRESAIAQWLRGLFRRFRKFWTRRFKRSDIHLTKLGRRLWNRRSGN